MIAPKRPEYKIGICCERCEKPIKECECSMSDIWSRIRDEALDSPTHGQAKENNRKVTR